MADDPDIQAAVRKNALALKLLAQGRQREALQALNEAIRIAPAYPHTYANRALVFDQMSLPLQAEAEREHARELAAAAGYSEAEIFEPMIAPEPAPLPRATPPAAAVPQGPSPEVSPAARTKAAVSGGSLSLIIASVTVIMLMVVAVVVLPGLLSGSGDDKATPGGSGPSSTAANPSPPPPEPLPATAGSPFSSESLGNAWRTKGFGVSPGQPFFGFSGFQVAPVDIVLARSGDSARLAAFVYKDADAPQQDWHLVIGSRPSPKPGRSLPSYVSIWWNANVVVVVLASPEDISADALDAFLNLSP